MPRLYAYLDIIVILIIPLLPAILLYSLFGTMNLAQVEYGREIHLGGPVGAYFAFMLLARSLLKTAIKNRDPYSKIKKRLQGSWDIQASSLHDTQAEGVTTISVDEDGDLSLSGTFKINGKNIGTWHSIHASINNNRFTYVYVLEEAGADKITWCGVVTANVNNTNDSIEGIWKVYGPEEKSGEIKLSRQQK